MLQCLHHGLGSFSTKVQDKCSGVLLQNQNIAQPQYLNFICASDISAFFSIWGHIFYVFKERQKAGGHWVLLEDRKPLNFSSFGKMLSTKYYKKIGKSDKTFW